MKFDKIDIKLINELYTVDEEKTTYDLAKEVFNKTKRSELKKLDKRVRKRLEKLKRYGLVKNEQQDGRTVYSLDMNLVTCAEGAIESHPKDDKLPPKRFKAENIVIIPEPGGMFVYSWIPVEGEDVYEREE